MKNAIFFLLLSLNSMYAQNIKIDTNLQSKIASINRNSKILVWIYFKDKDNNLKDIKNNPNIYFSQKAISRRFKNIRDLSSPFNYTDLPVSKSNLIILRNLGIKVKQKSKWLNAVSSYINKSQIIALKRLNVIDKITEVRKFKKNRDVQYQQNEINVKKLKKTDIVSHSNDYGSSLTQNEVINTAAVHDLGYTGKGILICLMDAGFDHLTHEAFSHINILNTWDFVNNDSDVENGSDAGDGSHGTATLSLIGGYKEGKIIGTAFGANFILAKTENTDSETPLEEDNWIAAAEWADSLGADVFSTSLGYLDFNSPYQDYTYEDMDGNTAAITIAADLAVKKGIVVFNSAGNNGSNLIHNTLNAPADGDSVFAIGAVYSNGDRVSFSSVGPTSDGRIKPDFMAMGSGTYAAGNITNSQYISFSGTSASCPLAAGVAALLLEKDYNLTPIEVREILRNTSSNSYTPNNLIGWGIINALAAINQIPIVKLDLKVLLQGSYDISTSKMKLDVNSFIPKQSPYLQNPRRINSIPNNIVDWILVELRETPSGEVITSKSFLLRNDGAVVGDKGINETIEMNAPEGNYYIVIKNRNHLPIMSHDPVSLTKN